MNKLNGKRYIGITSNNVDVRWKKGYGYAEGLPIRNAFDKYGWDGFEHNILYSNVTEDFAKHIEQKLIKDLHTQRRDSGYNICSGGNGVTGWHPSKETRKKISNSAKRRVGKLNPNYGHKWTNEMKKRASEIHKRENLSSKTLRLMSESAKDRCGVKNPFFGKTHSKETKLKISKSRSRAVVMFDLEMNVVNTFDSIKSASKETSINEVGISRCCRGVTKTSGGYIWKYKDSL